MSATTCPRCGAPIAPGQRFCAECGMTLPAADANTANSPTSSQPETNTTTTFGPSSTPGAVPPSQAEVGPNQPGQANYNQTPPGYYQGPGQQPPGGYAPPPQGPGVYANQPGQGPQPTFPAAGYNNPPGMYTGAPIPRQNNNATKIILGIVLGVVLVCGLCGGLGYFVFNRTAEAVNVGLSTVVANSDDFMTSVALTPFAFGAPTSVPINRALPAGKRSFQYANLQFNVVSGVISNSVYYDPSTTQDSSTHLDLDLEVTNPTADYVSINSGLITLKLAGGTTVDQTYNTFIDSRDKEEKTLSFDVPSTTTWSNIVLTMDEAGKEPATLPLTGAAPTAPYPLQLALTGQVQLPDTEVTFKVISGTLDLDYAGKRATIGNRYLTLNVNVDSKQDAGIIVSSDSFRLVIAGQSQAPEAFGPTSDVVTNEAKSFTVTFLVPSNTTQADLNVGESADKTVTIPLDLSANKQ